MTKQNAFYYVITDVVHLAKIMAEIMDNDYKKKKEEINSKINEHKEAIAKLEEELSVSKGEAMKRCLPLAKRKQNEAWRMLCEGDRVLDGDDLWEVEEP